MKKIDFEKISIRLDENHPEIDFALVFGSSKDGFIHPKSDIDLAVMFGASYNENTIVGIIKTIENLYPEILCDLTILNSAKILIKYESLKGKLLFIRKGKENKYADFYSITCRKHEDYHFWMKRQLLYRGYEWNINT